MSNDAAILNKHNKNNLQELTTKEEELVVLKVELTSLHEKYKMKVSDVSKHKALLYT